MSRSSVSTADRWIELPSCDGRRKGPQCLGFGRTESGDHDSRDIMLRQQQTSISITTPSTSEDNANLVGRALSGHGAACVRAGHVLAAGARAVGGGRKRQVDKRGPRLLPTFLPRVTVWTGTEILHTCPRIFRLMRA